MSGIEKKHVSFNHIYCPETTLPISRFGVFLMILTCIIFRKVTENNFFFVPHIWPKELIFYLAEILSYELKTISQSLTPAPTELADHSFKFMFVCSFGKLSFCFSFVFINQNSAGSLFSSGRSDSLTRLSSWNKRCTIIW